MAKMTAKQKLAKALADVERYTAEVAAEEEAHTAVRREKVRFTVGQPPADRTYVGYIIERRQDTNGAWVRIVTEDGPVYRVRPKAVKETLTTD